MDFYTKTPFDDPAMSDHSTIDGHRFLARGPFCWGTGDTMKEAIDNMKKNWPSSSWYKIKKPRGTDPRKWPEKVQKVVDVFVIPNGEVYVNGLGAITWYLPESDATEIDGSPVGKVTHDPKTCNICTIAPSEED